MAVTTKLFAVRSNIMTNNCSGEHCSLIQLHIVIAIILLSVHKMGLM